ncbi:hypothetical protein IC611_20890 [Proteus mirabilis]
MKDNHSSDEHQQKVDVWEQMLSNYFYNKVLLRIRRKHTVRWYVFFCVIAEFVKMRYRYRMK